MRYILIACLICFATVTEAQNITKQQLDSWLLRCDTAYKSSKVSGYVVGKTIFPPNDSLKLNTELALIKNTDFLGIDPFWDDEISTKKTGKFTVLVLKKGEQSLAMKQSILKNALGKFPTSQSVKNATASTEPILLINGQPVPPADCLTRLSALKPETITDIYYSKHPVPQELYGPKAKNGIVTVWTK